MAEKGETGVIDNWTDNWALLRSRYNLPEHLKAGTKPRRQPKIGGGNRET
jgi:hypothetical protein